MGPTASGKTALSIAIAKHFSSVIVNVDSRQVFNELNIGTARPTIEEMNAAKHYFVADRSIEEAFTAGSFAKEARQLLDQLFSYNNMVVASGGSTLYFGALLHGIDEFPEVPQQVKDAVSKINAKGLSYLQETVRTADPLYFDTADKDNPRRLIRALEVYMASGQPYTSFLNQGKSPLKYPVIKIGIDLPRELLYDRINQRCDQMMATGLLDEVKSVYPYRHKQALQTVGYKEFFDWMDGKCNYEEAIDQFKQHTRNYAKRQMTWFRKEEGVEWFTDNASGPVITFIEQALGRAK